MKQIYLLVISALLLVPGVALGAYDLTCNSPLTKACGEYSFSSESDRDNFIRRCKRGRGEVLSEGCPSGPSCEHSSGGRTVTTFIYGQSEGTVQANCQRNGGTFNN